MDAIVQRFTATRVHACRLARGDEGSGPRPLFSMRASTRRRPCSISRPRRWRPSPALVRTTTPAPRSRSLTSRTARARRVGPTFRRHGPSVCRRRSRQRGSKWCSCDRRRRVPACGACSTTSAIGRSTASAPAPSKGWARSRRSPAKRARRPSTPERSSPKRSAPMIRTSSPRLGWRSRPARRPTRSSSASASTVRSRSSNARRFCLQSRRKCSAPRQICLHRSTGTKRRSRCTSERSFCTKRPRPKRRRSPLRSAAWATRCCSPGAWTMRSRRIGVRLRYDRTRSATTTRWWPARE